MKKKRRTLRKEALGPAYYELIDKLQAAGIKLSTSATTYIYPDDRDRRDLADLTVEAFAALPDNYHDVYNFMGILTVCKLSAKNKKTMWPAVITLMDDLVGEQRLAVHALAPINMAAKAVTKDTFRELEKYILDPRVGDQRGVMLHSTYKYYDVDDPFWDKARQDELLSKYDVPQFLRKLEAKAARKKS
ncbi:hypothetical protein [Corynebacterium heidelbergense]|uniref:Uncharacterized protein n=1 Tax=Corynebacterium heidelbergense TaxID=2055947 RepID=A0A364V4E6_9CORY|nr:hypothetical protein [Corynebacterium heidelbergense]RAV31515.1 hypothetical protein DLJ54_07910 [Corynebacterium heidelbergense]